MSLKGIRSHSVRLLEIIPSGETSKRDIICCYEPALPAVTISVSGAHFLAAGRNAEPVAGRALTAATLPSVQAAADTAVAQAATAALQPVCLSNLNDFHNSPSLLQTDFTHLLLTLRAYFVARGALAEVAVVPPVAAAGAAHAFASVRADLPAVGALQPVLHREILVAVAGVPCKRDFARLTRASGTRTEIHFRIKSAGKERDDEATLRGLLPDQPKSHLHIPHSLTPRSQYGLSTFLQSQPHKISTSIRTSDASDANASSITTVCL